MPSPGPTCGPAASDQARKRGRSPLGCQPPNASAAYPVRGGISTAGGSLQAFGTEPEFGSPQARSGRRQIFHIFPAGGRTPLSGKLLRSYVGACWGYSRCLQPVLRFEQPEAYPKDNFA